MNLVYLAYKWLGSFIFHTSFKFHVATVNFIKWKPNPEKEKINNQRNKKQFNYNNNNIGALHNLSVQTYLVKCIRQTLCRSLERLWKILWYLKLNDFNAAYNHTKCRIDCALFPFVRLMFMLFCFLFALSLCSKRAKNEKNEKKK